MWWYQQQTSIRKIHTMGYRCLMNNNNNNNNHSKITLQMVTAGTSIITTTTGIQQYNHAVCPTVSYGNSSIYHSQLRRRHYSGDRNYHKELLLNKISRHSHCQYNRNRYFSSNQLLGHSPMSNSNSIMNPGGTTTTGTHLHHMGISIPDSTYIPTAYEAIIGNVWQSSTWRRDKIIELKGELNALPEVIKNSNNNTNKLFTLDYLATERQTLDLHLVDGMNIIVKHVEENWSIRPTTITTTNESPSLLSSSSSVGILHDLIHRMEQKIETEMSCSTTPTTTTGSGGSAGSNIDWDNQILSESDWNRILLWLQKEIETTLATNISIQPTRIYRPIRDYMDVPSSDTTTSNNTNEKNNDPNLFKNDDFINFIHQLPTDETKNVSTTATNTNTTATATTTTDIGTDTITKTTSHLLPSLQHPQYETFQYSVIRYQLHITLAIIRQLQLSWKTFATMTDQDIDRAAALQLATTTPVSISCKKLIEIIKSYMLISDDQTNIQCTDQRMDALWNLIDKDNDGLIDQVEMNQICTIAIKATQNAIRQFVQEVIDVIPLNHQPQLYDDDDDDVNSATATAAVAATTTTVKKLGWLQRRRIRNEKATFMKRLNYILQNHFDNELEMPHRLRCIYTWSNKQHQNNKLNSILVQEKDGGIVTSVVGRKRYVELYPKISIHEFREVQEIHFPQLNRIGQEYIKSFREELWIAQGKGRQNRELQRDCTLFLLGVCMIDYIVLTL